MKPEKVKDLSKDLENFGRTVSEAANRINNVTEDVKRLKRLIGTANKENSLESKLIAAGVTCIISPDPVSDIAGVAMVITGTLLKKMRRMKAADIVRESRKLRSNLEEIIKNFH